MAVHMDSVVAKTRKLPLRATDYGPVLESLPSERSAGVTLEIQDRGVRQAADYGMNVSRSDIGRQKLPASNAVG